MYSFSPLRDHVSHILGVALRVAVFLYTVLQVLVASVCLWAVPSMRKVVVVWFGSVTFIRSRLFSGTNLCCKEMPCFWRICFW